MLRTLRFLWQHQRQSETAVSTEESTYRRGEEELPARIYRPARARGSLPGWVLLHGLTYTGREHPTLTRFARSVAASGALVLVPDVPEWRALQMAPAVSVDTIKAAVLSLDARDDVIPGRTGLVGFSFGATQALIASTDPALAGHLSALAAWGGYYDVPRLFHFAVTGDHELDGVSYHAEPDPYGRWVVGANYLTQIPGHEQDGDVAAALLELAEDAGRRQLYAADAYFEEPKRRLRARLPESKRHTFDLFAPPAGRPVDLPEMVRLGRRLAEAAVACDPLIDPAPYMDRVRVRTVVAHARDDRLVPFTEGLRLCRSLPAETVVDCRVSSLYSHSGQPHESLGRVGLIRETLRFAGLLHRILTLV